MGFPASHIWLPEANSIIFFALQICRVSVSGQGGRRTFVANVKQSSRCWTCQWWYWRFHLRRWILWDFIHARCLQMCAYVYLGVIDIRLLLLSSTCIGFTSIVFHDLIYVGVIQHEKYVWFRWEEYLYTSRGFSTFMLVYRGVFSYFACVELLTWFRSCHPLRHHRWQRVALAPGGTERCSRRVGRFEVGTEILDFRMDFTGFFARSSSDSVLFSCVEVWGLKILQPKTALFETWSRNDVSLTKLLNFMDSVQLTPFQNGCGSKFGTRGTTYVSSWVWTSHDVQQDMPRFFWLAMCIESPSIWSDDSCSRASEERALEVLSLGSSAAANNHGGHEPVWWWYSLIV